MVKRTERDVDEFLVDLEGPRGDDMRRIDAAVRERMTGHERHLYEGRFWGGSDQQIVGYGVLDYTNSSGKAVEWFLVGLAAQKNYISMYVNAVGDEGYLLRDYESRLGKVKVGSASVSFDQVDDVEWDVLMQLITEAGAGSRP